MLRSRDAPALKVKIKVAAGAQRAPLYQKVVFSPGIAGGNPGRSCQFPADDACVKCLVSVY